MIERWYNLNGAQLLLRLADPSFAALLDRPLAVHASEPSTADFTLTIGHGEVTPAPAGSPLLFDGILPDHRPCIMSRVGNEEHFLVPPARLSLVLSPAAGRITVAPGEEQLLRGSLLYQPLTAALATGGQDLVHAAALVPTGSDKAFLLFGQSGAGKTTTSLACLKAGFRLLTDDASVLKRTAAGETVWGLTRSFKVHEKTAQMLPWLAPTLTGEWNAEGEQGVTSAALAPFGEIVGPLAYPIGAIIALGPRSADGHRLAPLSKAEALVRLASDNVARSLLGVAPAGQRLMRRLAALVGAVPTYQLHAGSDLESLPELLRRHLAE